jgi:hypothetical protein
VVEDKGDSEGEEADEPLGVAPDEE